MVPVRVLALSCFASIALVAACGGGGDDATQTASSTTSTGTGPGGCAPGEATQADGSCVAAGVPDGACGMGFESDGNAGCRAILPASDCKKGQMALPGETTCRDVAPCGSGTWGDVPIDASTVFVDQSYQGGASDGSQAKPWTSINAAITAAKAGALIAIAAGNYAGDLSIHKSVRLYGVCPSKVEIAGDGTDPGAVIVWPGADGTELHHVAIRGTAGGLGVIGAKKIVIDGVWIHDLGDRGMEIEDQGGPSSLDIQGTLVESTTGSGIVMFGSSLSMSDTIIRDVAPGGDPMFSNGLAVQAGNPGEIPATANVTHSIVERALATGVGVYAGKVTLDSCLIRGTGPRAVDQQQGFGADVQSDAKIRGNLTITRSVIADNHTGGVFASGADLTMDATVIRTTQPEKSDGDFGRGLEVDSAKSKRSSGTITRSLIDACIDTGVMVSGSDATFTSVLVRGTQPNAKSHDYGTALGAQIDLTSGERANVTFTSSVIQGGYSVGLHAAGSDIDVEGSLVTGIQARASDGQYGDGVSAFAIGAAASAKIVGSRVEGSARAGVSSFAGTIGIEGSQMDCNAIDLDSEMVQGESAMFQDLGDNRCGCQGAAVACQILTSNLTPPPPAAH